MSSIYGKNLGPANHKQSIQSANYPNKSKQEDLFRDIERPESVIENDPVPGNASNYDNSGLIKPLKSKNSLVSYASHSVLRKVYHLEQDHKIDSA